VLPLAEVREEEADGALAAPSTFNTEHVALHELQASQKLK
jgi:hypothetical protein